jgi:hypothetical protein
MQAIENGGEQVISSGGVGGAWISNAPKHPGETWDANALARACVRRKKQPAVYMLAEREALEGHQQLLEFSRAARRQDTFSETCINYN